MQELANKKLELMGQAIISLIQFLCDYFRAKWLGTNKQPSSNSILKRDEDKNIPHPAQSFPYSPRLNMIINVCAFLIGLEMG